MLTPVFPLFDQLKVLDIIAIIKLFVPHVNFKFLLIAYYLRSMRVGHPDYHTSLLSPLGSRLGTVDRSSGAEAMTAPLADYVIAILLRTRSHNINMSHISE